MSLLFMRILLVCVKNWGTVPYCALSTFLRTVGVPVRYAAVSYTHLDVYKRQGDARVLIRTTGNVSGDGMCRAKRGADSAAGTASPGIWLHGNTAKLFVRASPFYGNWRERLGCGQLFP